MVQDSAVQWQKDRGNDKRVSGICRKRASENIAVLTMVTPEWWVAEDVLADKRVVLWFSAISSNHINVEDFSHIRSINWTSFWAVIVTSATAFETLAQFSKDMTWTVNRSLQRE